MAWTSFSGWVWRGNISQRPSSIGIQTSTIWIAANFSNTAAGVSPGARIIRRFLQSDLQAVRQESNQDVRVGPMLQWMIDGPDSQFAFQRAKNTLDLRELDIARPQHRRIFTAEVAPQQIVPVALFPGFQLGLVHLERERLACDRFARIGKLNLHKAEGAASFFLGGADAQQQLVALGQAPAHHAQLAQQARQSFAPHGPLLLLPSLALGQHVEFPLVLVEFHLHRVAHLLPPQFQPFLLVLVDPAFGRPYQIKSLPLRLAHLLQNRFAWNAAIHHPNPSCLAVDVLDLFQKARSVVRSEVLPFITSYANGNPSGVTTRAITNCRQSGL